MYGSTLTSYKIRAINWRTYPKVDFIHYLTLRKHWAKEEANLPLSQEMNDLPGESIHQWSDYKWTDICCPRCRCICLQSRCEGPSDESSWPETESLQKCVLLNQYITPLPFSFDWKFICWLKGLDVWGYLAKLFFIKAFKSW